jgi:hypothetical protein
MTQSSADTEAALRRLADALVILLATWWRHHEGLTREDQ